MGKTRRKRDCSVKRFCIHVRGEFVDKVDDDDERERWLMIVKR